MFEKGKYISYANCGLPYYIGGIIQDREKLFVQTPEIFGKRFNLDVRTESEVISVDLGQKRVLVRNGKGEEYAESYDKLLLSPGAIPVRPPLPGIDSCFHQSVFLLMAEILYAVQLVSEAGCLFFPKGGTVHVTYDSRNHDV